MEEEKKFRAVEKTVKTLLKNVSTYLEEFQVRKEQYNNDQSRSTVWFPTAVACRLSIFILFFCVFAYCLLFFIVLIRFLHGCL